MKKPQGGVKAVLVFIIFTLLIPISAFVGAKGTIDYRNNGRKVSCKVTDVFGTVKQRSVTCVYNDENGDPITAHLTANKRVSVGDVVQGYVLPDSPDKVMVMPSTFLIVIVSLILLWLALSGAWALANYVKLVKRYDFLKIRGRETTAEIVDIKNENNQILFNVRACINGESYDIECTLPGSHCVGESIYIIYAFDNKGKFIMDIV